MWNILGVTVKYKEVCVYPRFSHDVHDDNSKIKFPEMSPWLKQPLPKGKPRLFYFLRKGNPSVVHIR